jgi:hypothetical protein
VDYSSIPLPISKGSQNSRTAADSTFAILLGNLIVFVKVDEKPFERSENRTPERDSDFFEACIA